MPLLYPQAFSRPTNEASQPYQKLIKLSCCPSFSSTCRYAIAETVCRLLGHFSCTANFHLFHALHTFSTRRVRNLHYTVCQFFVGLTIRHHLQYPADLYIPHTTFAALMLSHAPHSRLRKASHTHTPVTNTRQQYISASAASQILSQ